MKVILNRKSLLKLLDRCRLPAAQDAMMAHGKTVLLTAEQNPHQLRISAVGIALCIDTCHVAQVASTGSVVVDALRLRALVEAMPDDAAVTLAMGKDRLQVSAGSRRYNIGTLDAGVFPTIPEIPSNETPYLIPTDALAHALESTKFAMNDSPTQEHLNGVLLSLSHGMLEGIALNGHCAARSTSKTAVVGTGELFLPNSIQRSVLALCNEEKNLRCDRDSSRLYIETDDSLISVLLPGNPFAPWKELWDRPQFQARPVCAVDGDTLRRAVQAMLTAEPKAVLTMELTPPVLKLTLKEEDNVRGDKNVNVMPCSGEEIIDVQAASATAHFVVKMEGSYLAHALAPCNIVEIAVTDTDNDPLCLRSQDQTFFAAIMPMRR